MFGSMCLNAVLTDIHIAVGTRTSTANNTHTMQYDNDKIGKMNVHKKCTTPKLKINEKQVAQLSQRDRAAAWVSCGANINVVLRIQRTLL